MMARRFPWPASVAILGHAGIILFLALGLKPSPPPPPPAVERIALELVPLPPSPAAPPAMQPPPSPPEPPSEELIVSKASVAEPAPVPLPKKVEPKPRSKPVEAIRRQEPQASPGQEIAAPMPVDTPPRPPVQDAKPTQMATLSTQAAPAGPPPSYQSLLASHLLRFRKYPPQALRRGEQGIAMVRLVVDRSGAIVSATLVQSSGRSLLDEAALDWIRRADPVPALPEDWADSRLDVIVPLNFTLR